VTLNLFLDILFPVLCELKIVLDDKDLPKKKKKIAKCSSLGYADATRIIVFLSITVWQDALRKTYTTMQNLHNKQRI
jgi:hypothetical protein